MDISRLSSQYSNVQPDDGSTVMAAPAVATLIGVSIDGERRLHYRRLLYGRRYVRLLRPKIWMVYQMTKTTVLPMLAALTRQMSMSDESGDAS